MSFAHKIALNASLCAACALLPYPARATDFDDAMLFYEQGVYVHALDRFRAAAIAGDVRAQEILAFMYALGSQTYPGVPRDTRAAAHWFDLAARGGRPVSRYMACVMGQERSPTTARRRHCFDWVARSGRPAPR